MSDPSAPSVNSWLEDELYSQYRYDRQTVDPSWTQVFEENKAPAKPATTITVEVMPEMRALAAPVPSSVVPLWQDDQVTPLRGPALKIAENMAASLTVPTATSFRGLPVQVLDENRRAINHHRSSRGHSKLSYTHFVAWAVVRAIETIPALNEAVSDTGR